MKKWEYAQGDKELLKSIVDYFRADRGNNGAFLTSYVMSEKNFSDMSEVDEYLADSPDFTDPFLILDMDKAVARLEAAIDNGEKICIYGDYDADGVTSTAVMYLYLRSRGCDVMYYIPSREAEGYGLNISAVDKLYNRGIELIVTVDNGISANKEVEYANSLGIDTIVTDHHRPPEQLPEAVAVVDPHRDGDESPFKEFSGVGVAFKLIMALERRALDIDDLLDRFSDICAIGTVADVVSLTGENRMLVKEGLKRINADSNLGIATLRRHADCFKKDVTSGDIGFKLAPRINAVGRLDLSKKSVELLITNDQSKADEIAAELCRDNNERKSIEKSICDAAARLLDENEHIRNRKIIVVAGEGWHQGVIGLAATKIREIYGKPTIVITTDGENAKGSARSVEGFSIIEGITYCKELLTIFGGHPMAAGMSLPTENIDAFRDMLNEYADTVENEFLPALNISVRIKPGAVSAAEIDSLSYLEPFGAGNPKPVFAYCGVTLTDIAPLKDGAFVKLTFKKENAVGQTVNFSSAYDDFPYRPGDVVDIAVDLRINEFNGRRLPDSLLRDIKFSDQDNEILLRSKRIFEEYCCGKPVTDAVRRELSAERSDFALVYKYLRSCGGFRYSADVLLYRLGSGSLTMGSLLLILKAMDQLGLITMSRRGSLLGISVVKAPNKVELNSAPIMKGLLQ